MSISITEYVDITSGVGAGTTVAQRELIERLFTTNPAIPAGSVVEVTSLDDVATLFGTNSTEYRRAAKYFGWVSKVVTRARKLSFASFSKTAQSPSIKGATPTTTIATWKGIKDGALLLQVGTQSAEISELDFSGVTDLAGVATAMQTGIRAAKGSNFAGATVAFDAAARRFTAQFPGTSAVPAQVTVTAPQSGGTDITAMLGWTPAATYSPGASAQTPLQSVIASNVVSDNFGSFGFIDTLTLSEWTEIGEWVQAQNVKYLALVPVSYDDREAYTEALRGFGGVCMTLVNSTNTDHDEDIPGIILAATDYTKRNAAPNYMFNQFSGVTSKVTDTLVAHELNGLRINYYGQTQTAGQNLAFYQRGIVCGTPSTPAQMGVFANEMWFKSAATAQLMSLLLNMPLIPATDEGRAMVLASLQDVINRALFNGTFAPGKELTTDQKAYINLITGDERAWHQIQNIGYWVDAVVTQSTDSGSGVTEYQVDYTLLYSKADAINKITGRDILI